MRQMKIAQSVKVFLWTFACCVFLALTSQAQNASPDARKITGKILNKGEAVTGANVSVKGTKNITTTDGDGMFTIYAATGETLIISYVGMQSIERKVSSSDNNISISLSENLSNLQDVVVVGYGKMKKSDLSSAVVTISSAEIEKTVNTTLDQALQGRAANVYVSSNSGQPGAGSSVIIRGVSTITGNYQPLYVIDGVQIRPDPPAGGAYNQPAGSANQISGINPDDIDNISVLQGAAATSIYGAAGANGVLMITTKHGKAGMTKVSANSLLTIQDLPKFLPTMNLQQYAIYVQKLQALYLVGSQSQEIGDPTILGAGTDWQRALFKRTLMEKHSLSVSGGTDKTSFYVSGDYLKQNGAAAGSGFERASTRINLDNQATKWMKFGINLSANLTKEKVNTTNGYLINLALSQNPTVPLKNPDGSWGGPVPSQAAAAQSNPVALAAINDNYNTSEEIIGGIYVDINPIKYLTWHTEVNGNDRYYNNYTFNPSYTIGSFVNPDTRGSRSSSSNYWWSLNTRLQYDRKFDKHAVAVMVGHEAQAYGYQSLYGSGENFSTNSVEELSVADPLSQKTGSGKGDGAQESYFSRLNYTYNDKYIAQFVIRRDGSSNFGSANQWGTFPAASVAWRVSQEKFMQNISFINELKLRGEYGVSGNTSNSGGAIYSKLYAAATPWGGGFLPANYPNPFLKWEEDKTANIGFDLYMFNNRVEVIGDAYEKTISNLILVASGPQYLGGNLSGGYGGLISWPVQNYGGMKNKGFGITVNTVNISKKNFQWKSGFNFSVDRNKVTKLVYPINTQYYAGPDNSQAEFLTEVGQPLSMITGYIAEGLFQNYKDISDHAIQTGTPNLVIDPVSGSWIGDIKFKDINGDGVIDTKDRTIIGNPWPKFTYNVTTSFSYKGFDLNLFFTGVYGNQLLNLLRYENELPNSYYQNRFQSVLNFAQPSSNQAQDALTTTLTNPETKIYRPEGTLNGNNRLNQWDIESGSYLKLKNVRLSYRVPGAILSRTHVLRGLTATVQVQNVFTITKYTGMDPEVGMYNYKGVTNLVGMDEGRYPSTRSYSFSLGLDF